MTTEVLSSDLYVGISLGTWNAVFNKPPIYIFLLLQNFNQCNQDSSYEALMDCFETTDWEVLCKSHEEDIDSLTECITDYTNFCVENTVPTKKIKCYSNNKPWVTSELKVLLNKKKRAFLVGDKDEQKYRGY